MLPRSVRVTNLDAFRIWKGTEGLGMDWLMTRLKDETEPSDAMRAGTALHKALENAAEMECGSLVSGDYRFDFNCECQVIIPTVKECEFRKEYGDIEVVGHVDGLLGKRVTDYKSTETFDPDRYMESYQWRFYLDMSGCDEFWYQVFVIKPFGPPMSYSVRETHLLKQYRYPEQHADCERLVDDFREVMGSALQVSA